MKVNVRHEKIQEFLMNEKLEGIEIVSHPKDCDYYISGRYSDATYTENLKGVIIPYTGHNGIDIESMKKHNLKLFVTPTRSKYVAEKAVTLTLALMGKLMKYHTLLKEGNWADRNSPSRTPWVSLQGSTVGLFGYGRIGKLIHKLLANFGCEFVTIDRGKDYPSDIKLVKNVINLVQVSDVIIISAPLNHTTENTFDEAVLRQMKLKFLVNVGRGKIVNQKAVYEACKSRRLSGYASDVWYNYPKDYETILPSDYPIHELDNVVMSNHSGGFTTNTNSEVNEDLIKTLIKLRDNNFEDQIDLENLL